METLLRDIRYGIRSLLNRPGFTAIAVVTLALGIGANTAIFSVVNAVLLRPLPFPDSQKVMWLGQKSSEVTQAAGQPKFIFWREQSQSFESMAAYEGFRGGGNLAGGDEAEYVGGLHVSADFFRVLGINPILGRTFTAEDDTPGAAPVVILSEGVWRRRFGADTGDSGIKDPGSAFQVTFGTAGTFRYFCQVHPEQMTGTIVVRAGSSPSPTPRTTAKPTTRPTARPTAEPSASAAATAKATATASPTSAATASPTAAPTASPSTVAPASPSASTVPAPTASLAATPSPGSASSGNLVAIVGAAILLGLVAAGALILARRGRSA